MGKALEDLIQMNWTFEGSKERINCSRTGYSIFLIKRRLVRMSATDKRGIYFMPWSS